MYKHTQAGQAELTPHDALRYLKEGNERFRANLRAHRNLLQQVNETRQGQFPLAAILSCIDSRTSAELIFDQGLGDVFSIRIAGAVVDDDVIGSMEYATKLAGAKLVVVLGHSNCGAIRGACDHVQLGNLSTLLNKIEPSIYLARRVGTVDAAQAHAQNPAFVAHVTKVQVHRSLQAIVEHSVVLRELIEAGEVGLIGAHYDVETGEVEFYASTLLVGSIHPIDPSAITSG